MFRTILKANINIIHLLLTTILFVAATIFLVFVGFFLVWGIVGDAAYPASWDYIITPCFILFPMVVLLPIVIYNLRVLYKKGAYEKSKDFLLVGLIIVLINLFTDWKILHG